MSVVKRLLVTTALEETWDANEPIIFLGEWCKRYSRRDVWQAINYEVLPYHWDDRKKMFSDYGYLQTVYEKLLIDLSCKLNEEHNVEHGLQYWRILIGPWLGYFVQIIFDRWESLQQAIKEFEIAGTIINEFEYWNHVPNDMSEFVEFMTEDNWNHYIYSEIIKKYTSIPENYSQAIKISEPLKSEVVSISINTKKSIKKIFREQCNALMSFFVRDSDAFFLSTCLPAIDEFKLGFRMRQAPIKWLPISTAKVSFNKNKRDWSLNIDNFSNFESCIRYMIPRQIPKIYMEGYTSLIAQVGNLPWPRKPKLIWSSNSFNSDDVFKAWAAKNMESGTPLVAGQHGGHYGIGKWSFNEQHEMTICDFYLSWGWGKNNQKVKAVGQLKVKKPFKLKPMDNTKLLLVIGVVPRYSYWMYSFMVSRQFLDYLDDQYNFVDSLPAFIQESLVIRLPSSDFGWDQEKRWRNRFPNTFINKGQGDIDVLIRQSRLYISTYNATTFLESFSMNVPSVIYWNPEIWELRASAIPYFKELQEVGIFHVSPESAAKHVCNIWSDVDSWWNSEPVLLAVSRFCKQYSELSPNYLIKIETALNEVIDSSKIDN